MTKSSKPLWGTSKDAYFRRALRSEPGIGPDAADRLLRRFRTEVVQVRLREGAAAAPAAADGAAAGEAAESVAASGPAEATFDPYTPNVIVTVRTEGRGKALAALAAIASIENLRLLAREQQLSIGDGPVTADEIRTAIVDAADRRIANRRAAAR